MAVKPIVAYGCEILRTKCKDAVPGPETDSCIQDLKDSIPGKGLGLAAPQINVALNIFIIRTTSLIVLINPRIVKARRETFERNEGCLSIPGIFKAFNHRAKCVEIEYLDEKFIPQKIKLLKLNAVVAQHECDHLEGKNFIDYMKESELKEIAPALAKIEAGEVDVDYDMLLKDGTIKKSVK